MQDFTSYSHKQNRWIEGGLKCSYIEPKSDSLNTNSAVKNESIPTYPQDIEKSIQVIIKFF